MVINRKKYKAFFYRFCSLSRLTSYHMKYPWTSNNLSRIMYLSSLTLHKSELMIFAGRSAIGFATSLFFSDYGRYTVLSTVDSYGKDWALTWTASWTAIETWAWVRELETAFLYGLRQHGIWQIKSLMSSTWTAQRRGRNYHIQLKVEVWKSKTWQHWIIIPSLQTKYALPCKQ